MPVDSSQRKARATSQLSHARPTTTLPSPLASIAMLRSASHGRALGAIDPSRRHSGRPPDGRLLDPPAGIEGLAHDRVAVAAA